LQHCRSHSPTLTHHKTSVSPLSLLQSSVPEWSCFILSESRVVKRARERALDKPYHRRQRPGGKFRCRSEICRKSTFFDQIHGEESIGMYREEEPRCQSKVTLAARHHRQPTRTHPFSVPSASASCSSTLCASLKMLDLVLTGETDLISLSDLIR
jgi:hypothetical protein